MYNNSGANYPPGYGNPYQYQYDANYGYPGYSYQQQGANVYNSQSGWTPVHPTSYPQPAAPPVSQQEHPKVEVVQEIQQQKATLTKQREDYVRKAIVLRRELDQLKQQRHELAGDDRSEKELRSILKENEKLQEEINGKLKAIINVIEMLSGLIKDGKKITDLETELEERQSGRSKIEGSESVGGTPSNTEQVSPGNNINNKEVDVKDRYCYVYYDTGLHWCRACDKFPETAKEFLQHLQSEPHQDKAKENEVDTTPWHKLPMEPLLPNFEDAPKKRVPIKGLQFFIFAPSWYCKLCDVWIGDLHCASHHLKSQAHFQNYENFISQNPHWEHDWFKDREKAMTRSEAHGNESGSGSDEREKKKKRRGRSTESFLKDKKKKKRSKKRKRDTSDSSSSSSSSSDSSSDEEEEEKNNLEKGKSIRVAMRNVSQVKSIMDEDMSVRVVFEKLMEEMRKKDKNKMKESEDELINQWMNVANPVNDKEKNMLDSLKDRMKVKQDMEKAKLADAERRRKEKEKEENELMERNRRQAREEADRMEREKKRQEQEAKILEKDRGHVRFKTAKEHIRRARSSSGERDKRSRERNYKRDNRDSSPHSRSRRASDHSPESHRDHESTRKKPPGPPSYKKLPFIGRMPLFKKKLDSKSSEKEKEITKEDYEPVRKSRFETGNLAKAFIPKPDVVCFPMLSSIPPMMAPPEPTAVEQAAAVSTRQEMRELKPPKPPVITKREKKEPLPPPPPPNITEDDLNYSDIADQGPPPPPEPNCYEMYESVPANNTVHPPLEPPPLPPDDDLALLGICADDMAAQSF